MKYYDPNTIKHLMLVKVGLALTSLVWFCFFMWHMDVEDMFSFDQKMILILVILCVFYDDPLCFLALQYPSLNLSILVGLPQSLFFTTLFTYWLLGLAFVKKSTAEIKASKATIEDITGKLSCCRVALLLAFATFAIFC